MAKLHLGFAEDSMQCTVCVPKENMFGNRHVLFFITSIPLTIYRLVNENEVKQWKEQAEKMRKGKWQGPGRCGSA